MASDWDRLVQGFIEIGFRQAGLSYRRGRPSTRVTMSPPPLNTMNIAPQNPQWPINYAPGYIGFTIRRKDAVAFGIRWEESQWGELTGQKIPSHAFVFTGEDQTIEAFFEGVGYGTLSAYINDPDVTVLVRRPYHWTEAVGNQIVCEAIKHVGHKYGTRLIAAMLVTHSLTGKALDHLPLCRKGWFNDWLCKIADSKKEEICSELAAMSMKANEVLATRGILMSDACTIDPYRFFYDSMCFEPPAYAVELVP